MASSSNAAKYESLPLFAQPAPLITTTDDGVFQIQEDTIQQIRQIDDQLVVVAIAGLYRTGKSYLMNRIAGSTRGFLLGSIIDSKTKGIWAWCKLHPRKQNTVLLLLDSEGLGDKSKGDISYDQKIVTLLALLCNVLVYNAMGALNQDSIVKMTCITDLHEYIRYDNNIGKDAEQINLILPTLVFTLRDFPFDLDKMSPDEYMEKCLESRHGSKDEEYNTPRENIRKLFPNRKCYTFDRPGGRKALRNLGDARDEDLSYDFLNTTQQFINYLYTCEPKVLLSSKPLTGSNFATLIESYVHDIRLGGVLDFDAAVTKVADIENNTLSGAAVEEFKRQINELKLRILQKKELDTLYQTIQQSVLTKFRNEAMFDFNGVELKLVKEMNELWDKTKEQNLKLVREFCSKELSQMYEVFVGASIRRRKYMSAGGYKEYKADCLKLRQEYFPRMESMAIDLDEVMYAFCIFMKMEMEIAVQIMNADSKLAEEDRQTNMINLQRELEKMQNEMRKLFEEQREQENMRRSDHEKRLEFERNEVIKKEKKKMQLLQSNWEKKNEPYHKQLEMLLAHTDTLEKDKQRMGEDKLDLQRSLLRRETQRSQLLFEEKAVDEQDQAQDLTKQETVCGLEIEAPKRKAESKDKTLTNRDIWTLTLRDANEKAAKSLLHHHILPTSDHVAEAFKVFGKDSSIFSDICQRICAHIKEKSEDILYTWVAYRYKESSCDSVEIVFVTCTNGASVEADFEDYTVYQRSISEFSLESEMILAKEVDEKLDTETCRKLKQTIAIYAQKLSEDHSNINMLSPSRFKSMRFRKENAEVTKVACIVFYVHIKGLIPIKENPFPKELNGFPTDVREGGFVEFVGRPNDFHEHLKMGCAIHAGVTDQHGAHIGGTLGGFVSHPEYGKCCLTCAHVVVPPRDMVDLYSDSKGIREFEAGNVLYQPLGAGSKPFGQLVQVLVKTGDAEKCGLDVALVRLMDRFPNLGNFPYAENYKEAGFDDSNPLIFYSGKVCNVEDSHISSEVLKFGAITGVTRGLVRMDGSFIQRTLLSGNVQFKFALHNQVEVQSVGNTPFAAKGDSGALVFAKDGSQENNLVAVGLLVGGMSDGRVMFTPICGIFSEMNGIRKEKGLNVENVEAETCPAFYLKLTNTVGSAVDEADVEMDEHETATVQGDNTQSAAERDISGMRTDIQTLQNEMRHMRMAQTEILQKLNMILQVQQK